MRAGGGGEQAEEADGGVAVDIEGIECGHHALMCLSCSVTVSLRADPPGTALRAGSGCCALGGFRKRVD